ncbi:pseudouridine synthase [Lactobacillus jensenii]|jgi:pseudouridylate synthase|uniref:Pseudouridine synthase n=1 Tax=Lactobacillus jensenii TaxID=109790 RepID=A0A5N1I8S7_LACJE|nr:pseudouridine synthase [Lactobacillus jensenii]EEQ68182.1 pseudouridylate synthase [Lactobacillus jensenii 1153]APT14979.1 16S rRNA pseudouridine(516) synthase [Lactobacillus jensenii]EEQ24499.1 pseudouridylate synthase [Lactobacillus jensenii 269-3]KAA9236693.1 rRNA pseudouridine synthase [Lactobacillus jensenii]KAA9258965.1 rRNA pseudouridine synthase [Lactobacillus jensenii]
MRIDKYLANMNVGSRKEVHNLIKAKKVTINEKLVKQAKQQVTENDMVKVDNQTITYQQFHYFMLNKPTGVITATEDPQQKTVLDLIASKDRYPDLAPVGRLDKDTTGLLLITNDGQLNHNLLSPKKHVAKTYFVELDQEIANEVDSAFAKGVALADGTQVGSAQLIIDKSNKKQGLITIHEGKFHQIKRMFGLFDLGVVKLKRIKMGNLSLDENLPQGKYRELTEAEISALKDS